MMGFDADSDLFGKNMSNIDAKRRESMRRESMRRASMKRESTRGSIYCHSFEFDADDDSDYGGDNHLQVNEGGGDNEFKQYTTTLNDQSALFFEVKKNSDWKGMTSSNGSSLGFDKRRGKSERRSSNSSRGSQARHERTMRRLSVESISSSSDIISQDGNIIFQMGDFISQDGGEHGTSTSESLCSSEEDERRERQRQRQRRKSFDRSSSSPAVGTQIQRPRRSDSMEKLSRSEHGVGKGGRIGSFAASKRQKSRLPDAMYSSDHHSRSYHDIFGPGGNSFKNRRQRRIDLMLSGSDHSAASSSQRVDPPPRRHITDIDACTHEVTVRTSAGPPEKVGGAVAELKLSERMRLYGSSAQSINNSEHSTGRKSGTSLSTSRSNRSSKAKSNKNDRTPCAVSNEKVYWERRPSTSTPMKATFGEGYHIPTMESHGTPPPPSSQKHHTPPRTTTSSSASSALRKSVSVESIHSVDREEHIATSTARRSPPTRNSSSDSVISLTNKCQKLDMRF